ATASTFTAGSDDANIHKAAAAAPARQTTRRHVVGWTGAEIPTRNAPLSSTMASTWRKACPIRPAEPAATHAAESPRREQTMPTQDPESACVELFSEAAEVWRPRAPLALTSCQARPGPRRGRCHRTKRTS